MLRDQFSQALKTAMRERDACAVATLRLVLASVKDRDIALRGQQNGQEEISDSDIMGILQTMIRQRFESIVHYRKASRLDKVSQEESEIEVIRRFLPKQMSHKDIAQAVDKVIREDNLRGLKSMGGLMSRLRADYPGAMDFAEASVLAKKRLNESR